MRLLLALLPAMRERGSGHIVNVSTVGVLLPPTPRWSAYQASKAAFDVWLRSVAAETHADGVTATSLYMALVHTRMSAPTGDFRLVPGLSRTRPPDSSATRSSTGRRDRAVVGRRRAALIDVAARGPSDRLVRLYARLLGGGAAPGASAAPRRGASAAGSARPATGSAREPIGRLAEALAVAGMTLSACARSRARSSAASGAGLAVAACARSMRRGCASARARPAP